jgi:hypothetical protein
VVKPVLLALFVLSAPARVAAASPAGTLNSFEGKVWEVGRTFRTEQGMAEILLAPGSFLRLGERSKLTLEAIGTPDVRAWLESGEALLEVIALPVPIVLKQDSATAVIRKPGLYGFDPKHSVMSVYAGEAQFSKGGYQTIASQGTSVGVRSHRKYALSPIPGDPLLSWSRIRSEQLSDESAASALAYPGGAGWDVANWYRIPWSGSYTFLSASGNLPVILT